MAATNFEQVDPKLIDGKVIDGRWVVIVDPPLERAAQNDRVLLRMLFTTRRIKPHDLRIVNIPDKSNRDPDEPQRAIQEEQGLLHLWRLLPPHDSQDSRERGRWDPAPNISVYETLIDPGQAVAISWLEPADGARLVALGRAEVDREDLGVGDQPTTLQPFDGKHADLAGYKRAVEAVAGDRCRTPAQIRAARFWLSLDLATSLADPAGNGDEVADAIGVPRWLVNVDTERRKWLTELLQTRWKARANCAAAGVPFDLLFGGVPGEAYCLSKDVADLVMTLMRENFGGTLRDAWQPVVEFACGSLRRPGTGDRLNVEPNSMAMASFAEVIDFASMDAENQELERFEDLTLLRKMFVSIIEPFTDNYLAPARPKLMEYYSYTNKADELGSVVRGAWTPDRISKHIAKLERFDYPELALYWGRRLAVALSAEPSVLKCKAWGRRHVHPLNETATADAGRVVRRALELETEREDDAGA